MHVKKTMTETGINEAGACGLVCSLWTTNLGLVMQAPLLVCTLNGSQITMTGKSLSWGILHKIGNGLTHWVNMGFCRTIFNVTENWSEEKEIREDKGKNVYGINFQVTFCFDRLPSGFRSQRDFQVTHKKLWDIYMDFKWSSKSVSRPTRNVHPLLAFQTKRHKVSEPPIFYTRRMSYSNGSSSIHDWYSTYRFLDHKPV